MTGIRTGRNIVQNILKKKLNIFGPICRILDVRLLKQVVFGIVEGSHRRGKPNKMDKRHKRMA